MAIRGYRYFGIVHFQPSYAKQERINSLSGSINLDQREQIFVTEATSSCSAYYWSETELTGSEINVHFCTYNHWGTMAFSGSELEQQWEYNGTSSYSSSESDGWGWLPASIGGDDDDLTCSFFDFPGGSLPPG
jgi:hypothetical protein